MRLHPYVLLSILGLTFALPRVAAQQPSVPVEYAVVQRLLHEAYPELTHRRISIALSIVDDEVVVAATPARDFLRRPAAPPDDPLVHARVRVSADRRVVGLSARGTLLEDRRNAALKQAMDAHPDWTDGVLRAWLTNAGASYGPSRFPDTSEKINASRWRVLLGEGVLAWDMRFQWRDPAVHAADIPSTGQAGWTARVSAMTRDQRPANYRLRFEPFSGRLVEIQEQ